MCLLLACVGLVKGHPLVCVANRDEYFDRPSEPVAARGGEPAVWCGLDQRAGGTWLGMNAAGVVVVLTNRLGEADATRTSRGGAAMAALTKRTAQDAAAFAAAWASVRVPNPFSLFAGDAKGAWFAAWNGPDDGASLWEVEPGLHTLTNTHDLDELPAEDVLRAAGVPAEDFERGARLEHAQESLLRVARSHAAVGESRSAVCVHGEGRGTVSSAFLAVDSAGRPARLLASDGPPCTTPYRVVV